MANFKPVRGTSEELAAAAFNDGYVYFCTDDGSLSFDSVVDGVQKRTKVNEKVLADILTALDNKYDIYPYDNYVGSVPCTIKDKTTGKERAHYAVMAADNVDETLVFRGEDGTAEIEDPTKSKDIANKEYSDKVSKKYLHRLSIDFEVTNDQPGDYNGHVYAINFQFQMYLSNPNTISTLDEFKALMKKGDAFYKGTAFVNGSLESPLLEATISASTTANWFFGYWIDSAGLRLIGGAPDYKNVTVFPPTEI